MKDLLVMAGNTAAHALWSVSDGEQLSPILSEMTSNGEVLSTRLMTTSDQAEAAVNKKFESMEGNHKGMAFIQDTVITLKEGKTDGLIMNVKSSDSPENLIQLTIPYRHAKHKKGFAIHRLKISALNGFSEEDLTWITDEFFDGVESHQEGIKLWNDKYEDKFMGDQVMEDEIGLLSSEMKALKRSPFLIFFLVAASNGKVNKKEVQEFINILSSPAVLKNNLMSHLISNIDNEAPAIISDMTINKTNYIKELRLLKNVIDSKIDNIYANDFKIALLTLGRMIAENSGRVFGFEGMINKEEKTALASIAACLGLQY